MSKIAFGYLVVFVVVVVGYLALHANRYENCAIQPSWLAWPTECI